MKNSPFKGIIIRSLIAFSLMYVLYSCTEITSPRADAYTINGKITFVDSNFAPSGGYYVAASYQLGNWSSRIDPRFSPPIVPRKVNDSTILEYPYRIADVPSGFNVVDVEFIDTVANARYAMGVYGCDTSHQSSCYLNPPLRAEIVTTSGVLNIDFKSHADTSKRIF